MSISKLVLVLDNIQVKRVRGGDAWVNQLNESLQEQIFSRELTGRELLMVYHTLSPAQQQVCADSLRITQSRFDALIDEVLRIREAAGFDESTRQEVTVNVVSITLTVAVILIAIITAAVTTAYLNRTERLPDSKVLQIVSRVGDWVLESDILP